MKIDMPAIIDRAQALACAAIAARAPSDDAKGSVIVRTPRALNPLTGQRLRAGDNFRLDFQPLNYSRIVRITKRTEDYKGKITLDVVPERGCYPSAAVTTPDPLPNIGVALPQPIENARVLELPPALAGSPIGIYIAILAQRPVAKYPPPHDNLTAQNITNAAIWFSRDGASYDWTGAQTTWAVRATLLDPLDATDTATLARVRIDDTNIDLDRITAQSESAQLDDTLLLLAGDELLSIGAIQLDPDARRLAVLRARQGTAPAAHPVGDEVWLVFRDDIGRYAHSQFAERVQAHFKLETCNPGNRLPLENAPDIAYTFRDRGPEAPTILFDALPVTAQVGIATTVGVKFGDSNGDLDRYKFEAQLLDPNNAILQTLPIVAGAALPVEQTILALRPAIIFPRSGAWRLHALASDQASNTTELFSDLFTILPNTTGATFETVPTPPPAPALTVDGGFQSLLITLRQERITEVLGWQLSVQASAGVVPAVTHDNLQNLSLTLTPLPANTTRYIRARAQGKNGIPSDWSAEVSATTLSIDKAQIDQSLTDAKAFADAAAKLAATLDDKIKALADSTDGAAAIVNKTLEQLATARDAIARDIASLTTLINGNYGDMERDSQTHTDAEQALAQDILTLQSKFNDATATLQQSLKTQADNLAALAQRADTLYANYQSATAALAAETTARSDADKAFTQQLAQLTAQYDQSISSLNTSYTAQATQLAAISQTLTTLSTQVGQNAATITAQSTATADALKAQARDIASILSLFGDTHAAVQTLAETLLDADGNIIARWAVTLDADGQTAEMEMFAKGGADPASQIRFKADLISKNYVPGQDGWRINYNGDAEFNNVIIRDTIIQGTLGKLTLSPVFYQFDDLVPIYCLPPPGVTKVFYTLNGDTPTQNSTPWPINFGGGKYCQMNYSSELHLKVRGFDNEGRMTEVAEAIYIKNFQQIDTPAITLVPNGNDLTVNLSCKTPDAKIHYTLFYYETLFKTLNPGPIPPFGTTQYYSVVNQVSGDLTPTGQGDITAATLTAQNKPTIRVVAYATTTLPAHNGSADNLLTSVLAYVDYDPRTLNPFGAYGYWRNPVPRRPVPPPWA